MKSDHGRSSSTADTLEDQVGVARFPEPDVRRFAVETLQALGAPADEARINADGLVTACLWWHPGQGQGLEMLPRYARWVRSGVIVPAADMQWVRDLPACALLDAAKGFGYVAARRAMTRAIQYARNTGVAMVAVCHSNDFGVAGYHAKIAADAGLIGIAMTNAAAEMAPWGSAKPVLGTNPWGVAVPRGTGRDPIVLDMALTQSGKGMMRWLARAGVSMPEHWALTSDGRRTTDPSAGMDGALLPAGDYKGYGLSFMTDVLTGVMTGSLFGLSVFQDDRDFDVGHLMIAIDPGAFLSRSEFESRLERLIDEVKSSPPIDATRPVMLPGETELERARHRLRDGIPIDIQTTELLEVLAAELNVPFPLAGGRGHGDG